MDRFIKKIKSFVNNILIKTKRFKKPIAFTLSACCIVVAVILCSFFVRNNAKDDNEEKEVLMGAEQTAPSSEPISESTTEPTETETEPTEASTEPTEIPTEPETESAESQAGVNYTYFPRDTALPGDSVEFDILDKTSVGVSDENAFVVPIQGGHEFDNKRYFDIDVVRCADDISELYRNGFGRPIGEPYTTKTFGLEQYDDAFFGDEYALIVLFHSSSVHKDIQVESVKRAGSELCIEASTPLRDMSSGSIPNCGWYTFCTPLKVRNEDLVGIDSISVFLQAAD